MNRRSSRKQPAPTNYQKLLTQFRKECIEPLCKKRPFFADEDGLQLKRLNAWTWPTLPPSDKPTTTQIRGRDICCMTDDRERRCDWDHIGVHISPPLVKTAIQNHYNLKRHGQARHSYVCVYHWRQIKYSRPGRLWGGTKEDVTMPVTETELVEMEADIEHVEDFSGPSTSDDDGENASSDKDSVLSTLESPSLSSESEMTSTDDEDEEEEEEEDEEDEDETSTEGTISDAEEVEFADKDLDRVELVLLRARRKMRDSTDDSEDDEDVRRDKREEDEDQEEREEESGREEETPLVNGIHLEETLPGEASESEVDEEMQENGLDTVNGEVEVLENGIDEEDGESDELEDEQTDESEEDSEEEDEEGNENAEKPENSAVNFDMEEDEDSLPDYDPYKYESDDSHPQIEEDLDKDIIENEGTPWGSPGGYRVEEETEDETEDMPTSGDEEDEQEETRWPEEQPADSEEDEDDEIIENPEETAAIIQGMSEFEATTLEKVLGMPGVPITTLLEQIGKGAVMPKTTLIDTMKTLVREEDEEAEGEQEGHDEEEEVAPRETRLRRRHN